MSRRKKLVISIAALLVLAVITAGAVAAIIIYTGSQGNISGSIETGTVSKALNVTAKGTVPTLVKGVVTPVPVTITNIDPAAAHTPTAWTVAFTTNPSTCASHLSYTGGLTTGTPIASGMGTDMALQIDVATTLPSSCSAATWQAQVTGTTNP